MTGVDLMVGVGVLLGIGGVCWLALGLVIPADQALLVGTARLAGDSSEQNRRLPAVRDRVRQSRHALAGLVLLLAGALVLLAAIWLM